MDKISVWSMLFVSFPEELLIVLITLAAAGHRDVLNFKNKKNILKLLTSSSVMVVSTVLCRSFLPSATLNFILQFVLFYLIIITIYRYRIFVCIPSFFLSISIIIISEALFVSPIMKLFNLSLQHIYENDFLRILVFLPDRISQLIVILIICRLRNISLSVLKLKRDQYIPIIFYFLMVISSMTTIESSLKNPSNDFATTFKLLINVIFAIGFTFWAIYNMFSLRKKILIKENIHDIELHHVKQLLEEGKTNYAIELIDFTLNEKGYYKN